jgi:hypothetical protein
MERNNHNMKTKTITLLLLVAALVVAGCASPASRIRRNPELFASIPAAEQELIKQGRIGIGFTPDMVRLALGEPDYIARRIDRTGTAEIWRYRSFDPDLDVRFSGFNTWGGWGPGWGSPRHPGWRGWPAYYGWGWNAAPAMSDHLHVTIKDGRVVEINQLR